LLRRTSHSKPPSAQLRPYHAKVVAITPAIAINAVLKRASTLRGMSAYMRASDFLSTLLGQWATRREAPRWRTEDLDRSLSMWCVPPSTPTYSLPDVP